MTAAVTDEMTASEKILADLEEVYPNLSPQLRRAARYLMSVPTRLPLHPCANLPNGQMCSLRR